MSKHMITHTTRRVKLADLLDWLGTVAAQHELELGALARERDDRLITRQAVEAAGLAVGLHMITEALADDVGRAS